MEHIVTKIEFKSEEWAVVSKSSHGEIYEKRDGTAIITGTWDGKGMKYEVHFKESIIKKDNGKDK